MANVHRVVLGMLILQIYVHAAPGDVSKLEDIANVEPADLNSEIAPEESKSETTSQGSRQKRQFFNFHNFGFPPLNPLMYPNYNRGSPSDTGSYGYEDPFVQIHNRLQEIANVVRQPPPPPPQLPIYFPVIYIPQAGCQCPPDTPSTQPTQPQNPPGDNNQTMPNVVNRFPDMDDDRQNWGFVVNETDSDDDDDDYDESDGSRPISFDPIRVDGPVNKAPPPVEHGTVQSNAQPSITTTTNRAITNPNPPRAPSPPPQAPTTCDGAVLSCCHQLAVTYDCFAVQGCPDPTSYGNPCDPDVILKVIDKYQSYYGQKKK